MWTEEPPVATQGLLRARRDPGFQMGAETQVRAGYRGAGRRYRAA